MKRFYEAPKFEIEQYLIQDDLLDASGRIPDDGEIDDEDIFA